MADATINLLASGGQSFNNYVQAEAPSASARHLQIFEVATQAFANVADSDEEGPAFQEIRAAVGGMADELQFFRVGDFFFAVE